MRRLNGKRFILGLMALMLCVMVCAPAFASVGDRVLFYSSDSTRNEDEKILNLFPYGDGFIIVMQKGNEQDILRYADISAEPETFIWKDSALSDANAPR